MAIIQSATATTYDESKPIATIKISGTQSVETLNFLAFNGALTDINSSLTMSADLSDIGAYRDVTWSNGAKTESISVTPSTAGTSEFSFTIDDGVNTFTSSPFLIEVYALYVDGVQSAKFTQELMTLNGIVDSDNITTLEFGVNEDYADENGMFNFDDNNVERVSVALINPTGSDTITTPSDKVSFADTKLRIELGAFDVIGINQVVIKAYTAEHTDGIALCYPGNRESNLVARIYEH